MSKHGAHDRRIAVVLSGCGYKDGSEITEAVSTLIAIAETGAEAFCFAPSDALNEAARIARDKIRPLSELHAENFDAVVFPGGYGAAKRLSNWAEAGSKAKINPEVEKTILAFHKANKPIGAICIAPNLVALALGKEGVELTIGNDEETAAEIQKTGATHTNCSVTDYISDRQHKVITTPAYMYDNASPFEVYTGVSKMIHELVEMA